jgi:signal transduction histidine kinase
MTFSHLPRPALAERAIPLGLLAFGLLGLVLTPGYASAGAPPAALSVVPGALGSKATSPPVVTEHLEGSLVLLVAYGFLLLGGWLTWRSRDPLVASWRSWLSRLASLPPRAQLRALLVIPVFLAAAEFLVPSGFVYDHVGGAAIWLAAALAAAVIVLRRWPGAAAPLAVAGLFALGLAGLVLSTQSADALLVRARSPVFQLGRVHYYGLVVLAKGHPTALVVAQAVALLAAGAWLVPQTFPAARRLLGLAPDPELTRQVERLTESRAVVVDTAASDLRRLERDLHDGAQARLVAVGMSLRAAERLIVVNPDAARALVAEARDTSARALTELRELVRGVHPPVLADRGLADAVRALALDCRLAVQTQIDLPGRVPAPVETACYFAVAELLTNAAKHSGAREARIDVRHRDRILRIEVTDFGLGGADPAAGSGLAGVEKRLAAFDGIMAISSPTGGPTIVVLEVPCALSSPKTSSC